MSRNSWGLGRKKERGQALVETTLMMAFFFVFLLAMIDLGRAYFVMVAVQNAAGEGALYGLANPTCVNQGDCGAPEKSIEWRIRNESNSRLVDPANYQFTVELDPLDPGGPGTMIMVEVVYDFEPILPALSAFGGSSIPIRRRAVQLIP